jgi:hypothetical protein
MQASSMAAGSELSVGETYWYELIAITSLIGYGDRDGRAGQTRANPLKLDWLGSVRTFCLRKQNCRWITSARKLLSAQPSLYRDAR